MTEATAAPRPGRQPAVHLMRKLGIEPDPWQVQVLDSNYHGIAALSSVIRDPVAAGSHITTPRKEQLPVGPEGNGPNTIGVGQG